MMDESKEVRQIPIEDIIPNRFQPRINFDEKALNELSESIKQHGIIQPLVLRPLGDKFEIIAGERRYKAATLAGLATVPGIVTEMDDNTSAEVALIENVQRKDLSSIEEAKSYKNMLERSNMTQDELAKKMGLSQSTIANKLRLLNLCEEVQNALTQEKISERHARALLAITNKQDQVKWLDRILKERLTVRQLDLAIKDELAGDKELEEGDIPKVNINPDINSIINNAVDINANAPVTPINDTNDILSDNSSNQVETHTTNKFFNYLEDQEVNMSMNETPTEENSPKVEVPTEDFSFTPEFSNAPENQFVPNNNDEIETLDDFKPEVQESAPVSEAADEPIFKEETIINQENQNIQTANNEPVVPESEKTEEIVQPTSAVVEETPVQPEVPEAVLEQPVPVVEQPVTSSESTTEAQEIEEFVFDDEDDEDEGEGVVLPSEPLSADTPSIDEPEEEVKIEPIPISDEDGVIDPVAYYDTLDPNFMDKVREIAGIDLKNAISSYRELTDELNEKGFSINIDETDLDNKYLIEISISKE